MTVSEYFKATGQFTDADIEKLSQLTLELQEKTGISIERAVSIIFSGFIYPEKIDENFWKKLAEDFGQS